MHSISKMSRHFEYEFPLVNSNRGLRKTIFRKTVLLANTCYERKKNTVGCLFWFRKKNGTTFPNAHFLIGCTIFREFMIFFEYIRRQGSSRGMISLLFAGNVLINL